MQIPPFQNEIEQLYSKIQRNGIRSIVITSPNERAGVSCTAQALTHRLLLAGKSALLVDLNTFSPATESLLDERADTALLAKPAMVATVDTELVLLGVRAAKNKALINQLRQTEFLTQQIERWHKEFDCIVVDAPPLLGLESEAVQAEQLAEVCDACILVVLTCKTTDRLVVESMRKLKSESVNLLGCILNDQFNPSLKVELLRELERMPRFLSPLSRVLKSWIEKSRFLAIEV